MIPKDFCIYLIRLHCSLHQYKYSNSHNNKIDALYYPQTKSIIYVVQPSKLIVNIILHVLENFGAGKIATKNIQAFLNW